MKIFTTILALTAILGLADAQSLPNPKLSAGTKLYINSQRNNKTDEPIISNNCVYRKDASQNIYISSFIKVYDGFDDKKLETVGAKIGTKAGNVWTVHIPHKNFISFTKINGIQYIDLDVPMERQLDSARKFTRVDSVHKGIFLPQPYTGKNVVVGVIDVGFDYSHPTLFDTSYQHFRVKRVWEQKAIGTPPQGISFGAEFLDSASILTKHFDVAEETHGTHVTGIAAGSGIGADSLVSNRYRGMAYESELVMVGIFPAEAHWLNSGLTDMIDGMNYIYNYAASVNKPAVVNLSWGGPIGPKDGKSLFSEACNNITGAGKIFVVSAGNNGQNNLHLQKTFSASNNMVRTISTFSQYLPEKRNLIDIWGDTAKTFCIQLSLYNVNSLIDSTYTICLDDSVHNFNLIGSNADTCFVNISTSANEFNGKPHILVQLYSRVTNNLCITLKGTSGKVNMWQGYVLDTHGYYGTFAQQAYTWAVNGDKNMTISDMVTTESAIGVAAYNSKPTYLCIDGSTYSYGYAKGRIAPFSSLGPTADGRVKPDIAGPGLALASAISSLDTSYYFGGSNYTSVVSNYTSPLNGTNYSYAMAAGTSMSSPAVSGIVALMLQVNHYLKPSDVKLILSESAIKDIYTTATPNGNIWGAGKANAYGAIKKTLSYNGITHYQNNSLNALVYPNPSSGNFSILLSSERPAQMILFNASGRICWQKNIINNTLNNPIDINAETLTSGIYLLKIITEYGVDCVKLNKE